MIVRDIIGGGYDFRITLDKDKDELLLQCLEHPWKVNLNRLDTLEDILLEIRKHAKAHESGTSR